MTDVTVFGNIGGDPELKFAPNGRPVLNFSLAENHSKPDGNGGFVEDGTTWRRVSVWGWLAEALAEGLKRGDRVIAVGPEKLREYQANDGSTGRSLEMNAKQVGRMPKKSDFEARNGRGNYQGGGQAQGNPGGQAQGGYSGQGNASQGGWGKNPNSDPWAASNGPGQGGFPDEPPF